MPRLVLFQPDIAQNAGTLLRLAACMGIPVALIEPCGFPFSDARFRRSGMDYMPHVQLDRHLDWAAFQHWRLQQPGRLVLLTTRGATAYTDVTYQPGDLLMLGRESAGVPEEVHASADLRVTIPMAAGMRSLNVAIAGAMVLGEALRQTGHLPPLLPKDAA